METFIEKFRNSYHLSENDTQTLLSYMEEIRFKKKEVIVHEGSKNGNLYLIKQGIWRAHYLKDGVDTTIWFAGAGEAVTLVIALAGAMCLWGGLMRIADCAGLTKKLAKSFSPFLRLLFPSLEPESEAAQAISMNLSANLLGMGNAATPFGIAAMKELAKRSPYPEVATDEMITFVVMNTASVQLIPATVAMLRSAAGRT